VALQRLIVDVAALEQLAQDVPHLLADAQQADRAAFGGFGASQITSSQGILSRRASETEPV
jgi:hypothetical protein